MHESLRTRPRQPTGVLAGTAALLRRIGFWSAVALPAIHVPALVLVGFSDATTPLLVALWIANAVALLVGHRHRRRFDGAEDRSDGG